MTDQPEAPVAVTFARPYTAWSGRQHKPDTTDELSASEADHVLRLGYARPATTTKKKV